MMFYNIFFIFLFSILRVVYLQQMMAQNPNNYGPYTITFDEFDICKGTKAKNLTILHTELDKELLICITNITFLVDTKIEEIKIQVNNIKGDKKTFLWAYRLNDPCKHYVFATVIKQYLNSNNCNIKKGAYVVTVMFQEMIDSFLGNSFFYGTLAFKADLLSSKGNVGCFNAVLTFKKKL